MYSNLACDNWAELLPFVQLVLNTAYSKTMEGTPPLSSVWAHGYFPRRNYSRIYFY